jgi:hypothetical protein
LELGIPLETFRRILKAEKFRPYKLQILHNLTEDGPDRRLEMCEWLSNGLHEYDSFTDRVFYSDEALFYVNGEVNRQNVRYWSQNNPRWMDPSKQQGAERIMVWCGL